MKYFLILFLFVFQARAQSTGFAVKANALVWENVYINDETDVANILERHPRLKITSRKGNIFKGVVKNSKNSCPGSSPGLVDAEINFSFEIEKSAGMYRVTITNVKVLPHGKSKKTTNAESYFLEKGMIKTGTQATTDLSCLEGMFNRMFTSTNSLKNKL